MKTLLKTLSTSALILATGLTVAAPQEVERYDPTFDYYRTYYGPDVVGEALSEVENPQVNELEDPCLSYYRDFYGPDAVGESLAEVENPQTDVVNHIGTIQLSRFFHSQ
ncbi:MAG: hypothetical protein DIZ77_12755 [endosymbiont of Seepiophila jonesi]|uniref:Uncharacterized protein n=1 Tax=endosymbiont of Lamellibrachia luymesi TaxID=2200907 RepID=A0A370E2M4_9GAMM|nr:MAG: hypothetical protein DIZ77_12755 [endosymbiont of Seepiophila jonesi]RDH93013.1 MAG: hypothetical protein DIZ79_01840 [endosymbiont of Lamellibrachia luymesi]